MGWGHCEPTGRRAGGHPAAALACAPIINASPYTLQITRHSLCLVINGPFEVLFSQKQSKETLS